MREQIDSISAPVADAVERVFEEASQATESSQNKTVVSMTQTLVSRAVTKGFQSAPFYLAVQEAVASV